MRYSAIEYKQNAFILALFSGKAEVAELLRKKHADLWGYAVAYFVPRDTPKKREGRLREYQPDRNAKAVASSSSAWGLRVHGVGNRQQLVASLQACAKKGLFDQYAIRRLMMLPLSKGYVDVAEGLVSFVEGGQEAFNETVVRNKEVMNPDCPEATIDYLIDRLSDEQMRDCASKIWDTKKADDPHTAGRYLKLLPYLDLGQFKEKTALIRIAVKYGSIADIELLASLPKFFTKASFDKALVSAQDEKRGEVTAWLIDHKEELLGDKHSTNLTL